MMCYELKRVSTNSCTRWWTTFVIMNLRLFPAAALPVCLPTQREALLWSSWCISLQLGLWNMREMAVECPGFDRLLKLTQKVCYLAPFASVLSVVSFLWPNWDQCSLKWLNCCIHCWLLCRNHLAWICLGSSEFQHCCHERLKMDKIKDLPWLLSLCPSSLWVHGSHGGWKTPHQSPSQTPYHHHLSPWHNL